MKAVVSKGQLTDTLRNTKPAIRKGTLEVLMGVFIEADAIENTVRMTTNDLEMVIEQTLDVPVERSGHTLVKWATLDQYTKGFGRSRKEMITLEEAGGVFHMSGAGKKFMTEKMDDDEYPVLPIVDEKPQNLLMDSETFQPMLKSVIWAASLEETRYFLNGVRFEMQGAQIRMITTDGRRLAMADMPNSEAFPDTPEFGFTVPLSSAKQLHRIKGPVEMEFHKLVEHGGDMPNSFERIVFADDSIRIITRAVEGDYPKYRAILTGTDKYHALTVEKEMLLDAILPFAEYKIPESRQEMSVQFHIKEDSIVFKSNHVQIMSSIPIEASNGHADLSIAFDAKYMREAVQNVPGEQVALGFKDPLSLATIASAGSSYHVSALMPMRIEA